MLANLPVPTSLGVCPTENMQAFKEVLEKLKADSNDSQVAAKTCYSRIKFLVDSTENNAKMFADLKKGEVKNYQKAKDTFTSRIKRFYDTRHRIETMETEIAELENAISHEKLKEKDLQNAKLKLKNLHQSLLKTKVEYNQMKVDANDISLQFNSTKNKFVRLFNAYAENVEHRVRDNLAFFVQKIGEFLSTMKLNNPSAASNPHSTRALEEFATRSPSSTDFNVSQLSTQMAENRLIIDELKFEEEKISDPDIYLKFVNVLEGEPKHIIKEIEQYSKKLDHKTTDLIFHTAANIILGRASVADIVLATAGNLDQRSLGNRVAVFLIALQPKFGRLPSKRMAELTREELIRSMLSSFSPN